MSPIQWDAGRWRSTGRRLPIPFFNTPKTGRTFLRLLGPPVGVRLHWTGKRSLPCLGRTHCPACQAEEPRTYFYAPGLRYFPSAIIEGRPREPQPGATWLPAIVCLPPGAAEAIPEKFQDLVVEMWHELGQVRLKVMEEVDDANRSNFGGEVEPFEVQPLLTRLWAWYTRTQEPDEDTEGQPPDTIPFPPAAQPDNEPRPQRKAKGG